MRAHDHDHNGPVFPRPKAARLDAPDAAAAAARAAAADQWAAVSAGGLLALQRAAGNRGVAAALQDQERARPVRSPSIQRLVYVDRKQLTEFHGNKDIGEGERSVKKMIADSPSRYFKKWGELVDYAMGQTETIGYLEKGGAWIRIPGSRPLVLGEDHSKIVLPDVAKAVGTDKYRYERAEFPEWLSAALTASLSSSASSSSASSSSASSSSASSSSSSSSAPSAQPRLQGAAWDLIKERLKEAGRHVGEDFWPKTWRSLAAFHFKLENPKYPEADLQSAIYLVDAREWPGFQLAIFAASRAEGEFPELYKAYQAHQGTLEPVPWTAYGERMDWGEKAGGSNVKESVEALQEVVAGHVTKTMEAVPSYERFSKGWRRAKNDYASPFKVEADRARDLAFYQHILQAKHDGIILFGFGYLHGERLKKLLRTAGVKYMKLEKEFLDGQRKKYPQ